MQYSLLCYLWHVLLSDPIFDVYKLLILFEPVLNQETDSEGPLPLEMVLNESIMLT